MINSSVIISGEASETDSDDEISPRFSRNAMNTSIQGEIITGEDSESDDENAGSISSAASALTQPERDMDKTEALPEINRNESLLHRKLKECNHHLYSDLEMFCQTIISQAGKNLSTIDQQLLKSQITLQTAVPSLRSLNINSALLKERLQSILSSKFISNIKTKSQ
ncbi:hypothetical protein ILUMI_03323 [Ignelater luminosus]|uniref:Biogenesis of lysosome-related organelles complex 1 subunit 3 n=1 Tax=Ignelater luminosus TaxID=2038154 RepID=A0A8K0GFL8_IGNLU|nr:hypothetical protein ILUMI_03323 [Ignelater luminosus]